MRINTHGHTDVRLPWGGARDSGFGREHGDVAIENFTGPEAMWMNLNVQADRRFPNRNTGRASRLLPAC